MSGKDIYNRRKKVVKRSSNFATSERQLLWDIAAQYRNILDDKGTCMEICEKKREAWAIITEKYNKACITGKRSPIQLKTLYDSIRCQMRYGKQRQQNGNSEYTAKNNISELRNKESADDTLLRIEHSILDDGVEQPNFVILEEESVSSMADLTAQDAGVTDSEGEGIVAEELEKTPSEVSIPIPIRIPRDVIVKTERDKSISESFDEGSEHFMDIDPIQNNKKKPLSAEALKRLYYEKKLINAGLEHKKLLHEIFLLKKREKEESKEHELKLLYLKKKLNNL